MEWVDRTAAHTARHALHMVDFVTRCLASSVGKLTDNPFFICLSRVLYVRQVARLIPSIACSFICRHKKKEGPKTPKSTTHVTGLREPTDQHSLRMLRSCRVVGLLYVRYVWLYLAYEQGQ